jgi:hypothetical protein
MVLTDHLQIHLLQLPEWQLREGAPDELDRWMYLFTQGEDLDVKHPPALLQTEEMRQAMQVLQHFSENERAYLVYQQRLEAERVAQTWQTENERLRQRVEQERQAKEQERQAKEQATQQAERERQENERLLALLTQAGIDPSRPSA